MIVVRCRKVPQRGSEKRKTADFRKKSHYAWRKSATKFLCVKTLSGKVVRHSLATLTMQKWLVGATPSIWNSGSKWPRWSEIADFLSLFARSDSAVTPSGKSSININRKSTTPFPMSPRWTSYVVPKPPKGGSKTQSVRNLNNKLR